MSGSPSASQSPIVARDRVIQAMRTELRTAIIVERRFTVEQVAAGSGIPVRTIRTYMANDPTEAREPCLSSALSLAVVLGTRAVNAVMAIIGYVATPIDDEDAVQPMELVASAMGDLAAIALAAADNRFDHTEQPEVERRADHLIEMLTPISSRGNAA